MKIKAIYKESIPIKSGYDILGRPKVFEKVNTPCFVLGHTRERYKISLLDGKIKNVKKSNIVFDNPLDKISIEENYEEYLDNKNKQFKQ